jgi:hypothetical protein
MKDVQAQDSPVVVSCGRAEMRNENIDTGEKGSDSLFYVSNQGMVRLIVLQNVL